MHENKAAWVGRWTLMHQGICQLLTNRVQEKSFLLGKPTAGLAGSALAAQIGRFSRAEVGLEDLSCTLW